MWVEHRCITDNTNVKELLNMSKLEWQGSTEKKNKIHDSERNGTRWNYSRSKESSCSYQERKKAEIKRVKKCRTIIFHFKL